MAHCQDQRTMRTFRCTERLPLPWQRRMNKYSPIPTNSRNYFYRRRKFYESPYIVASLEPKPVFKSFVLRSYFPKGKVIWPKGEIFPIRMENKDDKFVYEQYRHTVSLAFKRMLSKVILDKRVTRFYENNPSYTTPEWVGSLCHPWFLSFVGKPRPWGPRTKSRNPRCQICTIWNVGKCPHVRLTVAN